MRPAATAAGSGPDRHSLAESPHREQHPAARCPRPPDRLPVLFVGRVGSRLSSICSGVTASRVKVTPVSGVNSCTFSVKLRHVGPLRWGRDPEVAVPIDQQGAKAAFFPQSPKGQEP